MSPCARSFGLLVLIVLSSFKTAYCLQCYRCMSTNSSEPFVCNEFLSNSYDLEPESCDDVYAAKYCIKHVGRFEVLTLDCYQCSSADEWMCEHSDLVTTYLQPRNCNYVFEAQYCIKTVGRYGGGIGTKRFCSSVNLGNYCDYVGHVGDKLLYRTCVFTCDSNGCNPASVISLSRILNIFLFVMTFGFIFVR